jgi:hypothetical protein
MILSSRTYRCIVITGARDNEQLFSQPASCSDNYDPRNSTGRQGIISRLGLLRVFITTVSGQPGANSRLTFKLGPEQLMEVDHAAKAEALASLDL